MDNKEKTNELEIEIENEVIEEVKLSVEEKVYELDIRIQEIDAQIENYEELLYQSDEFDFEEELSRLKQEYKKLRAERKALLKKPKGKWDEIPVWMFAYGLFQIIFSVFLILSMVSLFFATWFLTLIYNGKELSRFLEIIGFFFVPFISILITTLILVFTKQKTRKKFMAIILSIQFVETVITVIIMLGHLKSIWNN